jgi:hypothetical protein
VGPDLVRVETEAVWAYSTSGEAETGADLIAGEEAEVATSGLVRVDVSGSGGPGIGQDAHDDGGPCPDGTEERVAGAMHNDGFISFVVFLEFERDGDGVREGQKRIVKVNGAFVSEELEVSQSETLGATLTRDGEVFAGAHCEEEGSSRKLVSGAIELTVVVFAQFAQNARGEGLLGAGRGVVIPVAFQLIR